MPNDWDLTDKHVTDEKKVENSFHNNCINLWTPESLLYPEKSCLSVGQLRHMIEQNIPPEIPKTFVMTQCFSGGFHLLGYFKDADGKPHRNTGNICGFTASTSDTTAAGCTAFVEESRYDGYERRMAEQLTGLSIITGAKFNNPIRQLSIAHDEALLKDNTKDVPLRTSEAYVLDYYYFVMDKKPEKNGETENADEFSLPDFLDAFWKEFNKTRSDTTNRLEGGLDNILLEDRTRRLDLVMRLQKQIETWFPGYKGELVRASLESIMTKRKALVFQQELLKEQLEKLKKSFKEKLEPVVAQLWIFLGQQKDSDSLELMEFELISSQLASEVIFARLSKEDPTLKKLERYRTYDDHREADILHWAQKQPKLFKQKEIRDLIQMRANISAMRKEKENLDVLEGQLRRLETQMIVAGMIDWMAKNHQGFVLEDVKNLVMCESNARL